MLNKVAIIVLLVLVAAAFADGKAAKTKCRKGFQAKVVKQATKNHPRVVKCVDKRECTKGKVCDQICTNTAGSYICSCRGGFYINPANKRQCLAVPKICGQGYENNPNNVATCWDINECDTSRPCDQLCTNKNGSYSCDCRPGYYIDPVNPNRCKVEKSTTTVTCKEGYWPTASGCVVITPPCNRGYAASENGCVDINECQTSSPCEHNCFNLPGSFRCTCNEGYETNDYDNRKCDEIKICKSNADIVLVLDSSGSIGTANYELQLTFASKFANHFDVENNAKFGALLFSDVVEKLFDLNDYDTAEEVGEGLMEAPYLQGTTLTNEAFDFIRTNRMFSTASGGQPNAQDIVVVFTDGQSTLPAQTLVAAENLKREGVKIIAVGIGNEVSKAELNAIASSKDDVLVVPSFADLDYYEQRLSNRVCKIAS